MSAQTDAAYYSYDFARVMALAAIRMTEPTSTQQPHVDAYDNAVAALGGLAGIADPPADMTANTVAQYEALLAPYEQQRADATEALDMDPTMQQMFGVDVQQAQATVTIATQWINAMMATRTEEGF